MPGRPLRVLFLEPFCGGSHRRFAEAVVARSSHRVELLSLPGSFWKWRMRGGHLSLLRKVRERAGAADALLVTDMLSLAELVGCVPELAGLPKVAYFHESQLAYPVPKGDAPDVHFGFTNLSTALAADRLAFNSRFHRDAFLGGIARFLKPMPDHRPAGLAEELRDRAHVVYPGIDCDELDRHRPPGPRPPGPPAILWNHRWEFDKQPEVFFGALRELAAEGLDFRVHVVGENFQVKPKPFLEAREALGARIATFGHQPRRADYVRVLWESDLVVSTAIQEFYGIAVLEAAYCGAEPLLPHRLAYPELHPAARLYAKDEELVRRIRAFIAGGEPPGESADAARGRLRGDHDVALGVAALDALLDDATRAPRATARRRPRSPQPSG